MVVNGRDNIVRTIDYVDLWEVSVVGLPANADAKFNLVAAKYLQFLDDKKKEKIIIKNDGKGESMTDEPEKKIIEKVIEPEKVTANASTANSGRLDNMEKNMTDLMAMMKTLVESKTEDKVEKATGLERLAAVKPGRTERKTPMSQTASRQEVMSPKGYTEYILKNFVDALRNPSYEGVMMYGTSKIVMPRNQSIFAEFMGSE